MREANEHRSGRWARILLSAGLLLLVAAVPARAADDCVGFLEQLPDADGTNGATAVHAADLDNDGDMDLLSASFNDELIAWYENDGQATAGFLRRVVSNSASGASSVVSADLDQDGDLDLLSSSAYDNKISWYENVGSTPPAFFERTITRAARYATDVATGDIDGDGDLDVLSANYAGNSIGWYEAITDPTTFSVSVREPHRFPGGPGRVSGTDRGFRRLVGLRRRPRRRRRR